MTTELIPAILNQITWEIPSRHLAVVERRFSPVDSTTATILAAALTHRSYANESGAQDSLTLLTTLSNLGGVIGDLAMIQLVHASGRFSTPAEICRFMQVTTRANYVALISKYELSEMTLWGSGIMMEQKSHSTLVGIANQLIGAICLTTGYPSVVERLRPIVDTITQPPCEHPTDHKALLQRYARAAGMPTPAYEILLEDGPGHSRVFTARVTVDRVGSELGTGRSKKIAEHSAAEAFLRKRAPVSVPKVSEERKPSRTQPPTRQQTTLLDRIRASALGPAMELIGFRTDATELLDKALTHRSWSNEAGISYDNGLLATVGSFVLPAIITAEATRRIFVDNLSQSLTVATMTLLVPATSTVEALKPAFDSLQVNSLMRIGQGQARLGLTDVMKAEVTQAIAAAAFLSHPDVSLTVLPTALQTWANTGLRQLLTEAPVYILGPKARLERYLGLIGCSVRFAVSGSGPGHARVYTAIAVIVDSASDSPVGRFLATGRSKKSAEQNAAKMAAEVIELVNSTMDLRGASKETEAFAQSLLVRLSERLPTSPAAVSTCLDRGLFASAAIAEGHPEHFINWAVRVYALQQRFGFELDTAAMVRFYAVVRTLPNSFTDPFSVAIKRVRSFVGELDPEKPPVKLFELPAFRDLMDLGLVVRTISRNQVATSVGEVVDAANLLARGSAPTMTSSPESRAVTFTAREGLLHAMAGCVRDAILDQCHEDMKVDVQAITSDRSVCLRFAGTGRGVCDWHVVVTALQKRLFWQFLACEIPLISVASDIQGVSMNIARIPVDANTTWVKKVFDSFYGSRQILSAEQSEVLAGMLHDLKNLISAFAVATSPMPNDRTARLKALFDASRHLDGATAITQSLSAIAGLAYKPVPSPIDPAEWFRGYIAKNLTRVPASVRIELPRNTAGVTISIVAAYLEAILDNLVKNALEAISGDGQVSLEWIVVEGPRTLVIEFGDSGRGISPEQIAEIRNGGNVATTKRQGSGLGIASIRSLLQRVDGSFEVSSGVGGGTHWTVLMPELNYEKMPEDSDSEGPPDGLRGLRE